MKKIINVALIGCGRAGLIHGRNFARTIPNARLVAVCDAFLESAQAAAEELNVPFYETDYQKIIERPDVDAVVIATPTKYHCEIVIAAANAKKHILCEKPMAVTVEECELMEKAVKKNQVKLQLGFMRRYDQSYIAAKKLIAEGKIGDVVMVRSNTRGPSIPKPWMYDLAKSNGPLAEVNSHDIDSLRWFTNGEFTSVYAIAGNYRCHDARKDFPDFYDNVILSATFDNGCQGVLDGAQGVLYGYDSRCEILGTKGCIYLGNTKENSVTLCLSNKERHEEYVNSWRNLFADAYYAEDCDFIRVILEDDTPRATGHDGKMAVLAVNAGNMSIKEKRIIDIYGTKLEVK
ncbi:MAG: Gfo/Idh/MocA family oxidoreductase [Bacilli bacterium]|jgi:predicted dehydrogenase